MRAAVLGRLLIILVLVVPPLDSFAKPARGKLHPCCKTGAKSCAMKKHGATGADCAWSQCPAETNAVVKAPADAIVPAVDGNTIAPRDVEPRTIVTTSPRPGFSLLPEHPPRIA